jgi:hypothetical protein
MIFRMQRSSVTASSSSAAAAVQSCACLEVCQIMHHNKRITEGACFIEWLRAPNGHIAL